MGEFPIFLINLAGSDARLRAATKALRAQDAGFDRLEAFDGRGISVEELPQYNARGAMRHMGRALTGGEVGCYISHVQAAKRFLATNEPFGLVLEDDMQPAPNALAMARSLTSCAQDHPPWHVAHLAAQTVKIATPVHQIKHQQSPVTVLRAHYFPMRTTALVWSRMGAEAFVECAFPITRPIDIFLRQWLQRDDMGIAVQPALFSTTQAASEIAAADHGPKRGGNSRTRTYQAKRIARTARDKIRGYTLRRAYVRKGPS